MENQISVQPVPLAQELRIRDGSVSIPEAAAVLGVCTRTIYYWIRNGYLETVRASKRQQRVLVRSLVRVPPRYTRPSSPAHFSRLSGNPSAQDLQRNHLD